MLHHRSNYDESTRYTVNLQPVGRRVEIQAGMTLLEAAQQAGVELVSLCGGVGACDSCKVRLASGSTTPPTLEEQANFSAEELAAGYRLACQTVPLSDVKVEIPPESLTTPQRLQVEGQAEVIELDPAVKVVDVRVDKPHLHDLRGDSERLLEALQGKIAVRGLDPGLLASFSARLREYDWEVRAAIKDGIIVALLPPGQAALGLAVDVGTTKLAGFLVNLENGEILAKTGAMNPQVSYGEDVISRISYTHTHPDGGATLQGRLVDTLNTMIEEMAQEAGAKPEYIVDAVVVGNTAMHHLFAGLPVYQLGTSPYVPAVSGSLDLPVRMIGLRIAPGASVHLPPNIAGYVGADHVAMALASGAWEAGKVTLALDIGTNTEITLAVPQEDRVRVWTCSCASGPAFEGAHIRDGMRAAPGAIERVQVAGDEVRIFTIGDQPPVGICGSGILDAVAQMLGAGVIDHRGVLQAGHPSVRVEDGRKEFVLAPAEKSGHGKEVRVTRRDVNEIQLAKGAIRAGIEILLREAGLEDDDIQDFIVAGAFGTYIDLESAVRVGMFPDLPRGRFRQVGNAAGAGARQLLLSAGRRRLAEELSRRAEYVELSAYPAFTSIYSRSLFFPQP